METNGPLGPSPTPAGAAQVALSAQRLAVLEHVRDNAPVRVAAAAAALGLHPNTIREHLDALVALGLAERGTAAGRHRGRPAACYRPAAADPATAVQAFATLATVLAGQLARISTQPQYDAEAAGMQWGRSLLDDQSGADDPRQAVLDALARLGFAPTPPGPDGPDPPDSVALRSCPLLDAARQYPEVVCGVHRGIVLGMLERLDAPLAAELTAFAEPGACRLRLTPR